MAEEKMKGLLIGIGAPKGEDEEEGEELEGDDEASLDAMGSLMDAVSSGDKKGALAAFRTLLLAEG